MIFIKIFQSTLLQEERHFGTFDIIYYYALSIHAPTRGATMTEKSNDMESHFQSTLLQEERP